MRKILKRNIQKQRQQRSVTYMQAERKQQERKQLIGNVIGGAVMGFVLGVGGFYAADHVLEKRLDAIGVSINAEQSK